jgi:hypothetical protein
MQGLLIFNPMGKNLWRAKSLVSRRQAIGRL